MAFSGGGNGNQHLCDICYDRVCFVVPTGVRENENDPYYKEEVSRLFPGCEGSLTLNRQLKVYFIMTKLFKLPSTQFLKLLLKSTPSSASELERKGASNSSKVLKNGKGSGAGGERLLYSSICTNCEQIVDEAFDLHQKAMMLQQNIDKLGETLFELKEIGQLKKREKHGGGVEQEATSKADEMLNLSLACLSGDIAKTAKKSDLPKRSIKAALRKRKACSETKPSKISKRIKTTIKTSWMERDPLLESVSIMESDPLKQSPVSATENKLKIKKETLEEAEIDYLLDTDEGGWISSESVNNDTTEEAPEIQEEVENVEVEEDDPDNDEDYVPSQSTDEDEDVEEDNNVNDGDYVPEKEKKSAKMGKKKTLEMKKHVAAKENSSRGTDNDNVPEKEKLYKRRKKKTLGIQKHVGTDEEFQEDDPSIDEDYVPIQSTTDEDEDMEEDNVDNDDGDYVQDKKEKSNKKRKKKILADVDSDASDISDDDDDDELEEVVVLGGSFNTTRDMNFNPNLDEQEQATTVYEFQCPECSRVYQSRYLLHTHTKKIHGFEMHYFCPKCPDLKFPKKIDLVEHRKQVHGYICEKCGKKLSRTEALVEHYKRVHKIKFTFTCPVCRTNFKTRNELRSHRSTAHVPSKQELKTLTRRPENEEEEMWANTPCSECGRVFLAGEKLDTHLITNHEYKMTRAERKAIGKRCYFCWKYLTLDQRHWIHRKTAHPDKVLEFPCEPCTDKNVVFQTTSELLAHFQTDHPQDTVHICPHCRWPFLDELLLKAHKKVHVNKKPDPDITDFQKLGVCKFNCWFCWELYPTQEKLENHVKTSRRHRRNFKAEFPCDDYACDRSLNPFASVVELNNHFSEAHSESKLYTCGRCNWSFLSKNMLTLHGMNHVPRRASQFKCPECDHISGILSALRDHYNRYHGLHLKIHMCVDCKERFETKKALTLHRIQMHDKYNEDLHNDGYPCEQCGKIFRTEKAVKHHQQQSHTNKKCPECEMVFQKVHKLTLHRQKVHGFGERYLCTVCGNEFLSKPLLMKHMERHSGSWYECHLCGLKMKDKDLLKKHVKRKHEHEKPKPNQKFVCTICGRGYSRKDSLDDHIRVQHTQESYRVWECEQCYKRFKRQSYLSDHIASATACRTRHTLLDGTGETENQLKLERK